MHTVEIVKKHPLFDRLSWVCRAVAGKTNTHQALRRLLVEPNRVSGTDGYRVHISKDTHDLLPGLYHLDKYSKTKVCLRLDEKPDTYPEITPRIWSADRHTHAVVNIECEYIHWALAIIIRAMPPEYTIQPDYLKDMLEGQDFIGVSIPEGPRALTFTNAACTQTGALMPFRMF